MFNYIRVLNGESEGGAFNRLILQTDSGEAWESNEEDAVSHFASSSHPGGGISTSAHAANPSCLQEHENSCHTLLFLKDQASLDAKLKHDGRYSQSSDLSKMRVITLEFPKYTPQLFGL